MSVLLALQGGAGDFTSTASWEQAPAGWAATATESFLSTATYVQSVAGWQATASEAFPSSATWLQAPATWAAVASEAFAATGSFVQAAAAWAAIAAETFSSTATWGQAAASWDATAVTGATTFAGTWDQAAASWDASATTTDAPLTFTGAWEQTQTWAASAGYEPCGEFSGELGAPSSMPGSLAPGMAADCEPEEPATGIVGHHNVFGITRLRRAERLEALPFHHRAVAEFVQAPAGWKADMETYDDDSWLVLFDEPALIGAR